MKVRKKYTVTVLEFRNLTVLTTPNNQWVRWMQKNATCGVSIYDCTFREAVDNLKILEKRGALLQIRR